MPAAERDRFQAAVAKQLASEKRTAFRGDVALKLDLATTSRNAPHAHTIAKNLLDLLSARRSGVKWSRTHLLYKDDRQIQALSVSCRHGEDSPSIRVEARPFAAMLDDLELVIEVFGSEMSSDLQYREDQDGELIDSFRDLKRNEAGERRRLGDRVSSKALSAARPCTIKPLFCRRTCRRDTPSPTTTAAGAPISLKLRAPLLQ